jgi:uncharacterized membrane protein YjgN (DUF898 family)
MNTKITATLAVLAIATVAILVSSAAIVKPVLASSNNNNKDNNGHSVSKSDLRGVGNFLKCIANHGGNDISKKKSQDCVDNHLG